jgi:DNA-binding response OmpR family regulator
MCCDSVGMILEKTSVLLVDDEPAIHTFVGMLLRKAGYFVGNAEDGEAGLHMFKERDWDLVITDRVMPKMVGDRLAEEIRKISSDVPLILITGFLKPDMRVDLFDEVLEKPFTAADLLATIRRVLDRKLAGSLR